MNFNLSQKEVGERIAQLRKLKGFSQQDLAQRVDLSRSSLAQIELGNRQLNVLELKKFSMLLNFSLDDFLNENFELNTYKTSAQEENSLEQEERISEPDLNPKKFKNILLYILERCAGKPNVGETVLYKLLYFADFNYYELYEEHLSGATYRKLPFGPVPKDLPSIISQMIDEDYIKRIKTVYHGYTQTRYLPLEKADLKELKASEKEILDRVIEQFSDWSAAALSAYSHKDIPWIVSKEGNTINYELALYRELPYSVRNYEESEEDYGY